MAKRRTPRKITKARRERMERVLGLLEGGATYKQIGQTLGISAPQAKYDADDALDLITREPAERLIKLWSNRLEKLWFHAYAAVRAGDLGAIERGVRVAERVAKMHALDGADTGAAGEVESMLARLLEDGTDAHVDADGDDE